MADDEREEEEVGPKTREAGEQAAAMNRVGQDEDRGMLASNLDMTKVQQAMAALAAQQHASMEQQRQKERELAAVKVNQDDVALISTEFEIDKKAAERHLREAKGDVKAAIETMLMA